MVVDSGVERRVFKTGMMVRGCGMRLGHEVSPLSCRC